MIGTESMIGTELRNAPHLSVFNEHSDKIVDLSSDLQAERKELKFNLNVSCEINMQIINNLYSDVNDMP